MMSYTASAACSHHVSSHCYTEHVQHCGVVLSGRITTVVMSRSSQLCLCYIVEPNCSGMSSHLADASITCDRALDICEPNCMPGEVRHFVIPVVHSPLGGRGVDDSTRALLSGRRVRGHVAALEPTSTGG
jgi:hypothetical protein